MFLGVNAKMKKFKIRCEGFTRPECRPCLSCKDVKKITYDSFGDFFTKNLCLSCRNKLLPTIEDS